MAWKMPYFLMTFFAVFFCAASFLYGEELPDGNPPVIQDVGSEYVPATAGIDSAVQMAQEEVRDPFGSPIDQGVPADIAGDTVGAPTIKVDLQGIGFGSKDAYAVIGGEIFLVGEEKSGVKLLEVRRHEVDILVNGGIVTSTLFPDAELKKSREREKIKKAAGASPLV